MTHYLARTYQGLTATRRDIEAGVLATFQYAMQAYGYLVKHNERISPDEWIHRICVAYEPSARRTACITAIHLAMGGT